MSRRAVALGGVAALVAGLFLAVVTATGGSDSVFRSDADLFRRVALDPFGDGSTIADPEVYGDAYRYGRVFFPLAAWTLGLGTSLGSEIALVVLTAVAFGAVVGLSAAHVELGGGEAEQGLFVLLAPGLWLGAIAAFSEPFVIALLLGALYLQRVGRLGWSAAAFAAALLSREAVLVAVIPAIFFDWRERGAVAIARLGLIVAPLMTWWIWVRYRVGSWPFLDDSTSRRDALAAPFTGFVDIESLGGVDASSDSAVWVAVAIGAITVAAALAVVVLSPRSLLAWSAVAAAAVIPLYGPNVWRFAGEAVRTMAYPQVLVLVTLAIIRERGRVSLRSP